MRTPAVLAVAVSALALSSAANAAVVVDSGDVGAEYVIEFTGQAGGSPAPALSSVLTLTFNGTSNGGSAYNFGYTLLNDSSVSSRLRGFGFDVTGATVSSVTRTGAFGVAGKNGHFPEGLGNRDVCIHAKGGNCTGGPKGLGSGVDGDGTFTLNLTTAPGSIVLENFASRYQSISPKVNGESSGVGIGTPVPAVPEPSTWAMLIMGFAAVGMAMRRRDRSIAKITYA